MLSLAKVSTGAAAASYYEAADDYYADDRSPSQWYGDGAKRLGLAGAVDAATFRDLLDGKMPDGSHIHNAAEGRRGGTDFTFSAPKSVSMQVLIGGDTRLLDAHEKAVARALDYTQTLSAYRVTENGVTRSERSDNLLIATFRHDLSRNLDPNLHTHAVVINATQRPDGSWRALDQVEFYRQQMLIGALYRSELALEVQKLGYEVKLTHADGRFELAHMTPAQIEAFSRRSQAIESALAARGLTRENASAREKEVAALSTRERKTEVDRAQLRETWREQSQALGVNYAPMLQAHAAPVGERETATRDAVRFAIEHTTERQAVVSEASLVRAALEHGTGRTNLEAIKTEIARQTQAGELIASGARYTTKAAQELEREILGVELRGRGAVAPIVSEHAAREALAATSLNSGQRAAAALIVTTDARVSAVQGAAGTGKTTMLREANRLATAQGYRVMGLTPSTAAAHELQKSGIDSQTLAAFGHREHAGLTGKTVIVVDEASMVATKDMRHVLAAAEAAGSRVVLVGDVQQLKAIEAGKPFAQLQEAGLARVEMGEIQRQRDAHLKAAVELAAKGDVAQSLTVLQKHVVEIDTSRDRYSAIAQDYARLNPDARANTLIVAGTHMARNAINDQVRKELGLTGAGIAIATLERKDLTQAQAQARSSLSYQPGDLVQAQKTYDALGLKRGDTARVIEGAGGKVTLERMDGERIDWRPALQTNLTAYRENQRELALGDAVRFTANDHAHGIVNGERATVTEIDREAQTVTLQRNDGSEIALDATKPLHLDHGYCSTVHAAQGQTAERVLIEADTRSVTTNESAYYVAISRARSDLTIYTDDKALLPEVMSREDNKEAALEVNREAMTMARE